MNANPDPSGGYVRAFHETDTCQPGGVSQSWNASHIQFDGGRNDGFVRSDSGVWAMAYFDESGHPLLLLLGQDLSPLPTATSAPCWPRPIPTAGSCWPAPPSG